MIDAIYEYYKCVREVIELSEGKSFSEPMQSFLAVSKSAVESLDLRNIEYKNKWLSEKKIQGT